MADEEKNANEEQEVQRPEGGKTEAPEVPAESPEPAEGSGVEGQKGEKPAETPADEATESETAEQSGEEAADEPAEESSSDEEAPNEEPAEEVKPEEAQQKIETGMIVRVHLKIKDVTPRGDERERIQVFEGTVIAKKGGSPETATITVRKVSNGVGVERIFPLKMPTIEKIEIVKRFRTRRSKLYFLRGKFKKRLKEVPIEKE